VGYLLSAALFLPSLYVPNFCLGSDLVILQSESELDELSVLTENRLTFLS